MKIVQLIALVGTIVMGIALMNGFVNGDIFGEGADLLQMPWGVVSFVDLYVGFALFSVWIAFRESSRVAAVFWVLLMLTFGFFTGAVYTYIAAIKSDGDWRRFWFGGRFDEYVGEQSI